MRNYVIINGTNSLTIPGLAIRELPAISKTLMRNQKEEIDGRDGDIITELGYSAYDKTMTIGLYGSYDINQIIAFFNQKGTIVFSDEADKYYNFTILEKIDYDRLVKFRTASVKFHCQPFKYPVSETPVEIEAEYITAEAEDITLNNTGVAPLEIGLKGNTYQETTTGKNLCEPQGYLAIANSTYVAIGSSMTQVTSPYTTAQNYRGVGFIAKVEANKTYVISDDITFTGSYSYFVGIYANKNEVNDTSKMLERFTITNNTFTPTHSGYAVISKIVSTSGTTITWSWIQVELGSTATDYEPYTNGASPNPDYPQEVQVVTGDNTIKVGNRNLWDEEWELGQINSSTGAKMSGTTTIRTKNYIPVRPNTSVYYLNGTDAMWVFAYDKDKNFLGYATGSQSSVSRVARTTPANCYYLMFQCRSQYGTTYNNDICISYSDSLDGTYTPHQSQEYEINLGTLELCKISTYQDYLYKSGENWYIHREIGKVVLDGSNKAKWSTQDNQLTNSWRYYTTSVIPNAVPNVGLSDKFISVNSSAINTTDSEAFCRINQNQVAVRLNKTRATTLNEFKDWVEANPFNVYYVLETATDETITNEELIEQLEAILNAVSYEDQTNISQENDDMAFILDVSALKKGTDMAVVNNGGNIAAKPIIAVKGNGTLGIYLDNTQMFSLNMTSDITIDTENMEAYDPNTSQLRNRQVTGDYSKFALQPGNNTIKVTGDFTSVTISKYKRWL